ncbi:hypothetical protein HT136_02545 [Novosphingobium profundi]|uniref:hypothetical protein n=1 Tax=Novosphingobium profundi TaxID=1774954 RepID=UPI001BD95146|nr:hypothetical protein [Novosphingobium profundi]MBT0667245.1 hypothetical protein [Novosphingobium profundi]
MRLGTELRTAGKGSDCQGQVRLGWPTKEKGRHCGRPFVRRQSGIAKNGGAQPIFLSKMGEAGASVLPDSNRFTNLDAPRVVLLLAPIARVAEAKGSAWFQWIA